MSETVAAPGDISKDKDSTPVQPRLKTFPKNQIGSKTAALIHLGMKSITC